jgi:integrase
MPHNLLSDAQCRNAPLPERGKRRRLLNDGDGLYLSVTDAGVKSWQYRYRHNGKPQTATLGRYPALSLGAAREKRDDLASVAAAGNHLTEHKRARIRERTTVEDGLFRNVADDWRQREGRRMQWTPDYATEVERSIDNHLGDLLKLHVAKIDAPTVARVLARVDRESVSMSKKVRTRVRAIFDHAITEGLITLSPVPATRRRTAGAKRNYPAVTKREGVGEILRDARKADVCRGIKRAHEIIAVTAQRSGEIVPAEWAEFDLDSDAPTWTIPRSRMKMKKGERGDHLVPLPPRLRALLKLWKAEDGDSALYVCPAPRSKGHVTADALEKFYRRTLGLAGKHVPHSWRRVWKTWGGDAGKPFDALEAQLDHINIGDKIAGSYDEAARLDPRREIAAWYEGELTAARDGAEVIPLPLVA